MFKKFSSIFLAILLVGFIITPTVLLHLDDSIEISITLNSGEDEECNSLEIISSTTNWTFLHPFTSSITPVYYSKTYSKPHFNLLLPPPELS
ncbi:MULTISPECIES: hypothetical protein [Cellulophaga]|uniref:Uncharacterized protein n=2 Tax=Cellulophaga TaxID=104264 RepID=F0RFM7_CELLC|nr:MULTISPECIES: hypothetical protein [Cellulophaga]ADY28975.1 hypothetical protein Celly_1147 [Cellulophaga lytica DSM 7489]AIM60022.1 hypothetical protein IX49_05615 [Cellulophaga lytica]APU09892.1 hypothetical protein A5M85_06230 [Cellulophaga lytica]EWH13351.1 hypothetical protein KLA_10518 [Cellulophaga geojensis KL-A]MDO6854389.1 hypothetical protein [Cellulophaga lytica]